MVVALLNHFSEEPDIRIFEPRAVPGTRPAGREWLNSPLVWAIDDWHAPAYMFPRDCPRILWWPLPGTTAEDLERHERDLRDSALLEKFADELNAEAAETLEFQSDDW